MFPHRHACHDAITAYKRHNSHTQLESANQSQTITDNMLRIIAFLHTLYIHIYTMFMNICIDIMYINNAHMYSLYSESVLNPKP